ncbi:MAG: hypothetical protein J5J00_14090 [Deltaproteobacteria bacterium]|nr:hypothetical protein [Deltaproteobacteria bacterium]
MSWLRVYRVRKKLFLRELRPAWRILTGVFRWPLLLEKKGEVIEKQREQLSRSQVLTRDALFEHAKRLAEQHESKILGRGSRLLYSRFREHCVQLEDAHNSLQEAAKDNEVLTPGAEWLLDNYHLVLQQITDIKRHFPRGYDRSLPKLVNGKYAGNPRVYHLALELLIQSDSVVNLDLLTSFVRGYQSHAVLTMGEIWAVPIMLRFALIENLGTIVARMSAAKEERKAAGLLIDEIIGDDSRTATQVLQALTTSIAGRPELLFRGSSHIIGRLREMGRRAYLALQWLEERLREEGLDPEEMHRNEQYLLAADQVSIGNTVNSLRAISLIDWKEWFESVSSVEQVLKRDPSGLHHKCDFKTRDRYRHVVERIAKRSNIPEIDVANAVVSLAKTRHEQLLRDDSIEPLFLLKRTHIGFYLIGPGVQDLESSLGVTPKFTVRAGRWLHRNAFLFYGLAVVVLTSLAVFHAVAYSLESGASRLAAIAVGLLFAVPASDLAINLVQWLVTRLVAPDFLPKLDFSKGIPAGHRTVVAVQALFTDRVSVTKAVESLEVRYLANDDKQLIFGILADFSDADQAQMPSDKIIQEHAEAMIEELRRRHGSDKFFILFRRRQWNESQRKFMGWERKRGKIEEFNRLLLNKGETSFYLKARERELLRNVEYVITLDNDSQLPRGSARSLVGVIAHPLNAPMLNRANEGLAEHPVLEGYSVIQPRVGITLVSANSSRFARIFSGHAGLDPYTQTVSEVYQDLFREGSFVGKGIYHVRAFESALAERVPENAILSHDLFEGLFAKVALATDIELFDDFPSKYHVHARRQHRWVRGDWQLLPWIFHRVPNGQRKSYRTPLSSLARWKLIDNLRRSLLAPSLMGLFVLNLFIFGEPSLYLLMLLAVVVAFPVYANLAQAFLIPPRNLSMEGHVKGVGRDIMNMSKQALFTISFLPHQAALMLDAISITLWRLFVSRRNMLEWETAYHSDIRLGNTLAANFKEMRSGVMVTGVVLALAALAGTAGLKVAAPLVALWLFSPIMAKWLSDPLPSVGFEIKAEEHVYLNDLAFASWRYFRDLMTEENNYLAPDNVQFVPHRHVVDRTSVTNISLSLLSVISAYDLGYMALPNAVDLTEKAFASLKKLDRFHGHFLNWYNVHTLAPLNPRYISMVDSGNMLGHLMACRAAYHEFLQKSIFSDRQIRHLNKLLNQALVFKESFTPDIAGRIEEALRNLTSADLSAAQLYRAWKPLNDLLRSIDPVSAKYGEHIKQSMLYAADLSGMASTLPDIGLISQLLLHAENASEGAGDTARSVQELMNRQRPSLKDLKSLCDLSGRMLTEIGHSAALEPAFAENLRYSIEQATAAIENVTSKLRSLISDCSNIIDTMDFRFLYDHDRDVFPIGYDVDNARRDHSYYDLLASEARLGSFAAIALGQVPQHHWFSLGRPLTDALGGKALLSWSGTMFEYLMPLLVMKSFKGTLLDESYKAAVRTQILYTQRRGLPWGISESGYSGVDFEKTYQYHAFGVPGLGLKRGLEDDLVISPYSTVLALPIAFAEGMQNLRVLEQEGARGEYGFYEAVDYTPSRLSNNEVSHVVQSHLAHHQGMIVVMLNNLLNGNIMQERFHSDPQVKATELLLHERFPDRLPITVSPSDQLFSSAREEQEETVELSHTIFTPHTTIPVSHLLSNVHYALMIDNAGSGYSLFERDVMLTRWREDSIINDQGTYFFVRDLESGQQWSVTYQPTRAEPEVYEVIYSPDKIEFKRKDHDIFTHCEVTVSPEDNVEIRKLSFTNLSGRRRILEITSFAEVVLNSARADAAHPAFSKMFIESQFVEDLDCLLFSRRPRSLHEPPIYLMHMITMRTVWRKLQYETSRAEFIGRARTIHEPAAMQPGKKLIGTIGYVLDPVFSIRTVIELEPGHAETVSFITGAARDKEALLSVAHRYKQIHQISRAFEMAWSQSSVELRNERIAARQSQVFQRLANIFLFNVQKFRSQPELIIHNRLVQSALWRLGISGDLPIVLLRITEPEQGKVVQELLAAHHYLRIRGLIFDLVILNEYPGGYLQNLQEELEFMIRSSFSGYLMDKNGGVFLRTSQQVSQQEHELLQVVSRVVLSGSKGSLASQLRFEELIEKPLQMPENELNTINSRQLLKGAAKCEFFNGFGGFIEDGKAYRTFVDGEKFPPMPWSNVVANPEAGFLVTESGGGYSWAENSREMRLTAWSNDPISDPLSEVIYIKDQESGKYWCPTPRPVNSGAVYQVDHHLGKSVFETEIEGIHSSLTVAMAASRKLKWFQLVVENTTRLPKILELYFYADWVLGVQREETTRFLVSSFDAKHNFLYAQNFYNMDFPGRICAIGSNQEILTYTASRREFVGRNRDLSIPAGLERAALEKHIGGGFDSCGVIKCVISLRPQEKKELLFYMAAADSLDAVREVISGGVDSQSYTVDMVEATSEIASLTSKISVHTPDRSLDIMLNGWLIYQSIVCRLFARTGFYQSGGAYGFRDQLQDVLSVLLIRPELVRKQILLHASRQFPEGDVQHWWHPPSGKGIRTRITDNYLWLPYVTARYIQATGDIGILDEQIGFITGSLLAEHEMETYMVPQQANTTEPLYKHCLLAIQRAFNFGSHGLPLMGGGDWNDGMNEVGKGGKGESVWLGWFLIEVLKLFAPLTEKRDDAESSAKFRGEIERLSATIEEHAWDGEWYRRAYFDDGTPLGSKQNDECSIDSLSQSWGVISHSAEPERAVQAMGAVYEKLVDEEHGLIKLLDPPFNKGSLHPGYIKGYLPGIRENGGQYTHAASWTIIASALLGYGGKAHHLFNLINPINHTNSESGVEVYKGEPYVFCGDVYAAPPHEGRAGWSWYSGSAGWMYQAGLHYILGLKLIDEQLIIDPCIPKSWREYKIDAVLRGIKFTIKVENPAGVERGVKELLLDGRRIECGKIELGALAGRLDARVQVVMG